MKKAISLVLAVILCLGLCACAAGDACTCDCAQCADCEKKTQIADVTHADNALSAADQNDNVIEFETPIVVAENQYVRIEVTRFYQEYRCWKGSYPKTADSATEGATLEKFLVFKYCNKFDQAVVVQMDDMYLGSDAASYYSVSSPSIEIAKGKNSLGTFLVRTGEKETLNSMEELYSLDGKFYVWSRGEDGKLRNQHNLEFSIPNGMNSDSKASGSGAASMKNSRYLGQWQVADIKFAYDAPLENDFTDEQWEIFFEAMRKPFDNIYFVFTESGDCHYHMENGTTTGKWKETENGIQAGGTVFVAEGGKLVAEQDGFLLYWEKVSDSQELPES